MSAEEERILVFFSTGIEIYVASREIRIGFPGTKGDLHKSIFRDPGKLLRRIRRVRKFIVDKYPASKLHVYTEKYTHVELTVSKDFVYELTEGMNVQVNNELYRRRKNTKLQSISGKHSN